MTAQVTHAKVSSLPDGDDTDLVRPSDWNAPHIIEGVPEVATVTVDFGTSGSLATATLSAAWITTSSVLVASLGGASLDHDAEDAHLEQLQVSVSSVSAGSCIVMAFAPAGTWGRYNVNVVGI